MTLSAAAWMRNRGLQLRRAGILLAALLLMAGGARASLVDSEWLRTALATQRARAPAATLTRGSFLAPTQIQAVALAPVGGHAAILRRQGEQTDVWLLRDDAATAERVLAQTDATAVHWSRDGRWLFLESPQRIAVLSLDATSASRLLAQRPSSRRSEIAGADPTHDGALLVLEQDRKLGAQPPPRFQLWRLGADGTRSLLYDDSVAFTDFAFAADGRLAYVKRREGDGHAIVRVHKGGPADPVLRCAGMHGCRLLAVTGDDRLWLGTDIGANLRRLAVLDAKGELQTLHADPLQQSDLNDVVLDPRDGTPLIAVYRSTRSAQHALTDRVRVPLQRLQAQLPGRDLQIQVSHGARETWLVGERGSDLSRTRWYRFDPRLGALQPILAEFADAEAPDAAALAPKLPMQWRASDGLLLHGFLSVPPGRDPATTPLVVNVHGGPWSHENDGYAGTTQLLVNRGYSVFEPNFRGSTGHGRAYLLAAQGDFGNGRVFADIVEGTRALLAAGIGNRHRVGIFGASFGGYAALAGVSFAPELFAVAVAAVPPSDFGWTLRWAAHSSDASLDTAVPLAQSLKLLSLAVDDTTVAERLHAQSPLAHAARLSRPLLMLAGGRDDRVPIRSVTHYAAHLQQSGKDVSLFIEPEAGHGLDRPLTREAALFLLEAMLHRHLGGAEPSPPSLALKQYLQRRMRIGGPGSPWPLAPRLAVAD